ncbi:cysteine peptidase family C39 domain-containing protein [Nostoc sp. UHCC 0251]|uniref:cysteine peptidase family C39 domain-containing protein n=1 Tax=Nostoc sp. UHCC 0251 TaxID=3110240 RepID=UPI002B20B80D|nr:cysteine peptidase family C39 domain-containing protein [Nostoc sp. UHCC 0251]MEA5626896.1 cysteine peptidase family C39 domain-containing protein [Nostoc sp. UHCC 0251]
MNSSSSLRVRGDVKYTSNQQSPTPKVAMLRFLRLVAEDTNLESQFSQVSVLHEFQLGEEATIYGLDGKIQDNRNFLYSVCQGRVQLIASNATIEGEASTHLLLEALAVRASLSKLDSYYNPWVANWQEIHYMVVWRVKGDRILSNPGIGKDWLSPSQFEASRTEYALLFTFRPCGKLEYPQGSEIPFKPLLANIVALSKITQSNYPYFIHLSTD